MGAALERDYRVLNRVDYPFLLKQAIVLDGGELRLQMALHFPNHVNEDSRERTLQSATFKM